MVLGDFKTNLTFSLCGTTVEDIRNQDSDGVRSLNFFGLSDDGVYVGSSGYDEFVHLVLQLD
jgi:hypothetical protein